MDVNIRDDELLENEEQFFLNLQSLSPHILVTDGLERQTVTILDNECKTLHTMCTLHKHSANWDLPLFRV